MEAKLTGLILANISSTSNDELLFAVLSKGGKVVNHSLNFMIFCLTLGLWSFAWLYLTIEATKQKKILVAIDEDGFPFEETADQQDAIAAVLNDMQTPQAMDRLVCGDVGFGKTEVALHAVYRAFLNHKQTIFLCVA